MTATHGPHEPHDPASPSANDQATGGHDQWPAPGSTSPAAPHDAYRGEQAHAAPAAGWGPATSPTYPDAAAQAPPPHSGAQPGHPGPPPGHQGPQPGQQAPPPGLQGPQPGSPGAAAGRQPQPPAVTNRRQQRRQWTMVGAAAVAAAIVASVTTGAVTGAFGDNPAASAPTQDAAQQAAPVVNNAEQPDWRAAADAVRESVVALTVRSPQGEGAGSGVILDTEGNILTNAHVAGGEKGGEIAVTLADGRMFEAEIAGADSTTDLAVVRLTDPPDDLKPASLGSSEKLSVGAPVAAVGNPLGLNSTMTTGIISALDRPVVTAAEEQQGPGGQQDPREQRGRGGQQDPREQQGPGGQQDPREQQDSAVVTNAIQVDAAINPGNSGGPLFDADGQVIGITSTIASLQEGGSAGSIGLGFAIPIDEAQQIAEQLIEDGAASHAFLGVSLSDDVASVDDNARKGASVEEVESDSPAEEAGLENGDIITAIEDNAVEGAASLTGYVRQHTSGDTVSLTVVRDGQQDDLDVTLATREDADA